MPKETTVVEDQPAQDQDTVNEISAEQIAMLSDEELNAKVTVETPVEEIKEETVKEENTKDTDTDEGKEEFAFDEDKYKEMSMSDILEELKKEKMTSSEKQKMIDRQSAEVGATRKDIDAQKDKVAKLKEGLGLDSEELRSMFDEDPIKAMEQYNSQKVQGTQLSEEEVKLKTLETKATILETMPEFETMVEDIGTILKTERGTSDDLINAFKSNPYQLDATTLIFLASWTKSAKNNLVLKNELVKLKKANSNIADNINKAGNARPPLSKVGTSMSSQTNSIDYDAADFASMSNESLNDIESEIKKRRR